MLDNLVEWSFVLKFRTLLQANVDMHMLGESATSIYSYSVFLWAVPVCITLDSDVDCAPFEASNWFQMSSATYFRREPNATWRETCLPMADVPKFHLAV